MRRGLSRLLLVALVITLAAAARAEDYFFRDSGYTVGVMPLVPVGGRVISGVSAAIGNPGGTFTFYYSGYEPDRHLLHLRAVWDWAAHIPGVASTGGEQELTIPLSTEGPTRFVLNLLPQRSVPTQKSSLTNVPTLELEVLGVDALLQLQLGPPMNFRAKAEQSQ